MAWISIGHSNEDLCDKLVENGVIKSRTLLNAFKLTDRGDFVPEQFRAQAYFDRPFKQAYVHLSAPHMYATVLESLELREGHSFLNVGSGSGYLSCLAACLLGESGLSHGIDCSAEVVEHSRLCCAKWFAALLYRREQGEDDIPAVTREGVSFVHGNCFKIDVECATACCRYDRIYVGAGCPQERKNFFYSLLADDGIMVASINEKNELIKIVRRHRNIFTEIHISQVLFAPLIEPSPDSVDSAEDGFDLPSNLSAWTTIGRSRAFSEISESSGGGSTGTGFTTDDGTLSLSSSPPTSSIVLSHPAGASPASSSMLSSYATLSGSPHARSNGDRSSISGSGSSPATANLSYTTESPASSRSNSFHQSMPTPSRKGKKRNLLVQLPPVLWAPIGSRHRQFPPSFRKAVFTLLLASRAPFRSPTAVAAAGGGGSGMRAASLHSTAMLSKTGACVCGRIPLHIWTYIITFASRDWFVPTLSELQLLQSELAIEKQLREAAEKKLRTETASRLSAERERDMYRLILRRLRLNLTPGALMSLSSDEEDEDEGDEDDEGSDDEQEEMESLGEENGADDDDDDDDGDNDADDEGDGGEVVARIGLPHEDAPMLGGDGDDLNLEDGRDDLEEATAAGLSGSAFVAMTSPAVAAASAPASPSSPFSALRRTKNGSQGGPNNGFEGVSSPSTPSDPLFPFPTMMGSSLSTDATNLAVPLRAFAGVSISAGGGTSLGEREPSSARPISFTLASTASLLAEPSTAAAAAAAKSSQSLSGENNGDDA